MHNCQSFYKRNIKPRVRWKLYRHRYLLLSCVTFITLAILYIFGFSEMVFESEYEDTFSLYPLRYYVEAEKTHLRSPRSPKVSRLNTFTYTYSHSPHTKCHSSHQPPPTLLMIIRTAPCNTEARSAIRATWGNESQLSGVPLARAFMVGRCAPSQSTCRLSAKTSISCEALLERESTQYGDLIQGNFTDTYLNSTEKMFAAISWVVRYCSQARYAFFVDDDFYVSVPNLLLSAKQLGGSTAGVQPSLYMGYIRTTERPQRQLFSRHYISLSEYPFSRYPPYATGGCFLLSNGTLIDLYYGSLHLPRFRFDDVFLGMIARSLKIPLHHNENIHIANKASYEPELYRHVVASHWYNDPDELRRVWREQKELGYA